MSCLPEQPLPRVEGPHGAEVFGKQLVVYGRCTACKSRRDGDEAGRSPSADRGRYSHPRPHRLEKTHDE